MIRYILIIVCLLFTYSCLYMDSGYSDLHVYNTSNTTVLVRVMEYGDTLFESSDYLRSRHTIEPGNNGLYVPGDGSWKDVAKKTGGFTFLFFPYAYVTKIDSVQQENVMLIKTYSYSELDSMSWQIEYP